MRQIERQWCAAAGHVLDLRAQSAAHRAVDERFVLGALGDFGKRVLLAGLLLAAPDARGLGGFDKQAALPAGTGLVRGGVVHLLEHARHAQQVAKQWASGRKSSRRGWSSSTTSCNACEAAMVMDTKFLWVSSAPFGLPVEPEV